MVGLTYQFKQMQVYNAEESGKSVVLSLGKL